MTVERTRGIAVMAVFTFILFAMPRLNVKLGPIPIYIIDGVAAYIILRGYIMARHYSVARYPFRGLIAIITALIVLSEVSVVVYGGSALFGIYTAIEFFLAFGMVFAIPQFVRTAKDVELVLKALSLGLLVTASMIIMSSLPQTRPIAIAIFSIPQLDPANSANRYSIRYGDYGVRGKSLVGVSILSATFVAVAWPMVSYLKTKRFHLTAFWTFVTTAGIFLSPMGIVMAYSRQALSELVLILGALLIFPFWQLRSIMLRPVLISVGVVIFVGVGSSLFFFDRYVNRFTATFNDPFTDERESRRFLSFVTPFEHVLDYPQFFIVGAGSTSDRQDDFEMGRFENNHSLIGQGYFAHGMLSTFLFVFLLISAFNYANVHRRNAARLAPLARDWPRALYLAYLPMFPVAAFSPAFGSNVRGVYMFIFVLGLLSALRNPDLMASLSKPANVALRDEAPSVRDDTLLPEESHA
ncbi:hypothetical protein [Maritimibacter alexandrii]|uniref:hypothetical protein n=1 Tax=Maritimibacter alexandrii TaxID=2570355 RepID=UPI001108FB54|nr:hypothetical protein [Maritimibacter alexandrii]